jgi:L-aminopeptidase/D-esterase-like protein
LWGLAHAMKGGIGGASLKVGGITVAAVVAVNAVGDVLAPDRARVLAGCRAADGRSPRRATASLLNGDLPEALATGMATTIGVIGTDATLDKVQCTRLAQCGHDGLARSIDPVHTQFDGDTLFALATGTSGLPGHPVVLGAVAAQVVALAVQDAVRQATGLPGLPAARELGWV